VQLHHAPGGLPDDTASDSGQPCPGKEHP
jgi:hypothetical protein